MTARADARRDTLSETRDGAARPHRRRSGLIAYVNREIIGLDIGMEEMTDSSIANAVIARLQAHVPVRVNSNTMANESASGAVWSFGT
jgi:hypothetical protein